jgi:hypothetical protein
MRDWANEVLPARAMQVCLSSVFMVRPAAAGSPQVCVHGSAVRLTLTPRQARGDPELVERVTVPMVRLSLTMPSESRGSESRGTSLTTSLRFQSLEV